MISFQRTGLVLLGGLLGTLLWNSTVTAAEPQSAAGRVINEGGYVRIESTGQATAIDGDWRSHGHRQGDTQTLLDQHTTTVGEDHIRLQLDSDVLFDFGSDTVTAAAAESLSNVAQVIRDRAVGEILVVGHTDAVGSTDANQRLSERRALNVMRWLSADAAIPTALMVGRGMGERQPLVAEQTAQGTDDPTGRARNRRVEFFIGTTAEVDLRGLADSIAVYTAEADRALDQANAIVSGLDAEVAAAMALGGSQLGASTTPTACAAGRFCEADCAEGNCHFNCPAGARCEFRCLGGNCRMDCSAGAICNFSCSGGDCRYSCAAGSTCTTSCAGDGCQGG